MSYCVATCRTMLQHVQHVGLCCSMQYCVATCRTVLQLAVLQMASLGHLHEEQHDLLGMFGTRRIESNEVFVHWKERPRAYLPMGHKRFGVTHITAPGDLIRPLTYGVQLNQVGVWKVPIALSEGLV
jgi:hypothetical protein